MLDLGCIELPAGIQLPPGRNERHSALRSYVGEWTPQLDARGATPVIRLSPPGQRRDYVDPQIDAGIEWWQERFGALQVQQILGVRKKHKRVAISLSDAWTASTIGRSLSIAGGPVVVLQADHHRDLSAPLLRMHAAGYRDLMTNKSVRVDDPKTIDAAIRSGAIGMGSCLTLAARDTRVSIRRLRRHIGESGEADGWYTLVPTEDPDALLGNSVLRPGVATQRTDRPDRYQLTSAVAAWVKDLPAGATVVVHIDADYFNNRFNWNSDWESENDRDDPTRATVVKRLEAVIVGLASLDRPVDAVHLTLSPGFFPGEFWNVFTDGRLDRLDALMGASTTRADRAARVQSPAPRQVAAQSKQMSGVTRTGQPKSGSVRSDNPGRVRPKAEPGVVLKPLKTRPLKWRIMVDGGPAGMVDIAERPDGTWAINIKVNKDRRGQGLGAEGYRQAVFISGLPKVWARMSKQNVASRRAAERAGFEVADEPGERQLVLVWTRPPGE